MANCFTERYDEMTRYFGSDEFNELLKIIGEHDRVCQDDLGYNLQNIEGLTAKSFGKVCDSIYHNSEADVVQDIESSFGKFHIDYKDIRFHLMTGQGSVYWTTKPE